jgi:recombination protein RecA
MTEEERRRAIQMRLGRLPDAPGPQPPIPSGLGPLDSALGGGFPRGRIVELFGPPACGKTTLALQTVARVQSGGLTAAWIDADCSFDPLYAAALGVALDRLPVARPESAEEAMEIARQLAASAAVDLLVVDSAAALVPRLELLAPIGESGPGLQARVLASGLRKLAAETAKAGATALFLNQTRGRPEAGEEEAAETTAAGPALKLHAAVRVALIPGPAPRMRFRILKNKVAGAFGEGEIVWSAGRGFS